jgi:hypothetical protein
VLAPDPQLAQAPLDALAAPRVEVAPVVGELPGEPCVVDVAQQRIAVAAALGSIREGVLHRAAVQWRVLTLTKMTLLRAVPDGPGPGAGAGPDAGRGAVPAAAAGALLVAFAAPARSLAVTRHASA